MAPVSRCPCAPRRGGGSNGTPGRATLWYCRPWPRFRARGGGLRTGRGYSFGILSFLHLTCTIVIVGLVAIAAQTQPKPISRQNGSVTIWLVFYFVPSIYTILAAVLGATIVAGIAHRWHWIVGFVCCCGGSVSGGRAAVLTRRSETPTLWCGRLGYLGVRIAPEATMLAYSITRIVHPVAPARAWAPAPLN